MWGTLFFLFMTFASLSTVIAVFENIISFIMDLKGWDRKKAVLINLVGVLVLSMPCVLGYNVWSGITPLGAGSTILDLEDFIVSNNLLPLGSLVYLLFCTDSQSKSVTFSMSNYARLYKCFIHGPVFFQSPECTWYDNLSEDTIFRQEMNR